MDRICIKNAYENNLDHVTIDLPKRMLIVMTGPSGSGKSTLAFDTLYMEARRRYLDTLSVYARQFVGALKKPKVERITGLTPSIAVVQGTSATNPRSTVGTMTEVYDYIRLLWGRGGYQVCPHCDIAVSAMSIDEMIRRLSAFPPGTKMILYAPIVRERKGTFEQELKRLRASGFSRARIDGKEVELADCPPLQKTVRHDIDLRIDALKARADNTARLRESLTMALYHGNGQCLVERFFENGERQEFRLSDRAACSRCGKAFAELTPNLLAFNSSQGACEACNGYGTQYRASEDALIGNASLGLLDKAGHTCGFAPLMATDDEDLVEELLVLGKWAAKTAGFVSTKAWSGVDEAKRKKFLASIEKKIAEGSDTGLSRPCLDLLSNYVEQVPCQVCGGSRLNEDARSVCFAGLRLDVLHRMTVSEAMDFFAHAEPEEEGAGDGAIVARDVMKPLMARLEFIAQVGLGYLPLCRGGDTLSGGEAQRVRLAGLLGNGLTAVTYVLDEPSIGLHARDQVRLIEVLKRLRDHGNTVVVVEHDESTMRASDYLVDIGPKAGNLGGHLVYAGPTADIGACHTSSTIDYLLGRRRIVVPEVRRTADKGWIRIRGARKNNLEGMDVDIPLGGIVCVTGVSGSGKSTLINEVLRPQLRAFLLKTPLPRRLVDSIEGLEAIERLLEVDQKPIGRTPRSNPATYTKVFDHIRQLFAVQPEAKMFGYGPGRFSFNVSGKNAGRCETCCGAGVRTIEMKFLADTFVECESCGGKRFNDATLRVRLRGYDIAQILDASFDEALEIFADYPKIAKILRTVCEVGLGYLKLGQPSPTLSGGEAQRMKLSKEIAKSSRSKTLFILDEPSTGLHAEDIERLLSVLAMLADMGHTVIIIEHNLEIIKSADYVIDIGPEPGAGGGKLVACGTPEQVSQVETSHTGRFLREILF